MMSVRKSLLLITLILLLSPVALNAHEQQNAESLAPLATIDTTLWKYLSAKDRSQWIITTADSEAALRNYYYNGAKIYKDVTDIFNKIGKGKLTLEAETPRLIKLLEQVKDNFEQGLRLNPFDDNIRRGITIVYNTLEGFYAKKDDNTKRLQMIKNLLCLETDLTKLIDLFHKAGYIYFNYQEWNQAEENFHRAITAIFEHEESAVDTVRLFNNLYLRGMSQMKLYEDEPALTSFTYARMIAPDDNSYQTLTRLIDFINWDGGNIRAAEQYQNARRLYGEKNYEAAEQAFLDLLPIIKTEKAKNETQLGLSRIQFSFLNKKEVGLNRLWQVVKEFPSESLTGAPIDSADKEFWEFYSRMCLQMGEKYFNTDRKLAVTYLLKTSQIESLVRGKAFLYLAIMSAANHQICLDYCHQALNYQDQLSDSDKRSLYDTLYRAYLRKGDFDEALKWFKKFHELRA